MPVDPTRALAESMAPQQYEEECATQQRDQRRQQHEDVNEEEEEEDEPNEYDQYEEGDDDEDEDADDEYSSDPLASSDPFLVADGSTSASSSLSWCSAFLERDDMFDDDGAEDEELIDLRRQYGAHISNQLEKSLPTLTATIEKGLALEEETNKDDGAGSNALSADVVVVDDDWSLLGLECDCPCASCRTTYVAPTFEEFQTYHEERKMEMLERDEDTIHEEDHHPCDCLEFDPPASIHMACIDLFEDFFRFRVHLHRVTLATSIDRERRRIETMRNDRKLKTTTKTTLDDDNSNEDAAANIILKKAYSRSLALLKARSRRDLKHLELLEVCCNQLGWNQPSGPSFEAGVNFCEIAQPGPNLLAGCMIEFISYFLVHKTTCTNFDKAKITTLCANIIQFAVKTGDLDPSDRTVLECHRVCDRSMLDLPLADLIETELYHYVQDRRERNSKIKTQALPASSSSSSSSLLPIRKTAQQFADDDIFPSSATPNRPIHQVYQGFWLLESFTRGSRIQGAMHTSPSLLHLTPAVTTKSKVQVLMDMKLAEQRNAVNGTGTDNVANESASNPSSSSSSSSSSLTSGSVVLPALSSHSTVSVIVPMNVIDLLSESSDRGLGWQFNLELTRYQKEMTQLLLDQQPSYQDTIEPYFHITKAGHVNCA